MLDFEILKSDQEIKYTDTVLNRLSSLEKINSVDEKWQILKESVQKTAK